MGTTACEDQWKHPGTCLALRLDENIDRNATKTIISLVMDADPCQPTSKPMFQQMSQTTLTDIFC
jgi:hypothetical protein